MHVWHLAFYLTLVGLCVLTAMAPCSASAQLQLRRSTPAIQSLPPKNTSDKNTDATLGVKSLTDEEPSIQTPAKTMVAPRPLDGEGITINQLKTVDPDAIGLIDGGQGGFPQSLWNGVSWSRVSGLMPRIPSGIASPTLRDMVRRLLISQASVPAGKPLEASFVALRIDRLLAMGDIGNVLALLKITPDELRDEALARTQIEAFFFDNNNGDACRAVRNAAGVYSGLYWSQAQAFCLALSGQVARASLIGDLLREREDEIEQVFFAAIDALAGAKGDERPTLNAPTALHLSMLRAAGFQLPAEIALTSKASVLRAVALTPNASLDMRLLAAEKAHRIGALDDAEVLRLYLGIPFSKEELSRPISAAEESWTPRTRALLVRAAAEQSVPLAKAEALRQALQLGQERDGYAQMAVTSASVVAGIKPAAELLWFAEDAARVLFRAGRGSRAIAWYAIAAADRERIEEARDAEAALWPLVVLADRVSVEPAEGAENTQNLYSGDANITDGVVDAGAATIVSPSARTAGTISASRLEAWFEARHQADAQAVFAQAATFYALLEATGRTVPAALWQSLLDRPFAGAAVDGNALSAVWTHSLKIASADSRIGETVLLATVGAGDAGEKGLSLADSARIIAALRRAGLEAEARQLAVETAMAAGL